MELNNIIGNKLDQNLLNVIKMSYNDVRITRKNGLLTNDYVSSRLNVIIDENDIIQSYDFG